MPRRRRPDHLRITFALDDVAGDARPDRHPEPDPSPGPAPEEAAPPRASGAGRRRLRLALAGATAVGLVVAGMAVVDAASSRGSLETLRRSVGGVEPVESTPRELWSTDAQTSGALAALPGLLVVVRDDEAVAHDLDSGAVRWTVPLPRTSRCGGELELALTSPVPDETLVCVTDDVPSQLASRTLLTTTTGEAVDGTAPIPAPQVTVLDADGTATTRPLDASRGWSAPGPDGTVARFRRVGDTPAAPVPTDPSTGLPTDLSGGRAAVVTLEDARTGAVRWEQELPFVAEEGGCDQYSVAEDATYADLDGGTVVRSAGLVAVRGCGVDARFTPEGTRVDDPEKPADVVAQLPDGALLRAVGRGWAAPDGTGAAAVLEPDGALRWEPTGEVIVPTATDGTAGDLVLTRQVTDLVAHDATGRPRWENAEVNSPEIAYVVADGVAVVLQGMGSVLVGVDVETGRTLWTRTIDELVDDGAGPAVGPGMLHVGQAFTDGARALLAVSAWEDEEHSTTRLVALDLRDGEIGWRSDAASSTRYAAVQGRLLRLDLGDDPTVARLG
ncbi:PQQ-like domain-containing protein [Cellulosimicrobium aquatile]|uniref:PQQ-like domain-containing protein n=1 Tax=Cellulosimicrobium aquatile TaxID=1612203 RepID=A0A1N6PUY3_9MICO|nr:PQQ-binding-like beta-propeller repeat protein [Cellulosimicrobium aquatile]SIQ08095.1 PQQ-like domain-containing protein [Cellulosimicrobium aquatile]